MTDKNTPQPPKQSVTRRDFLKVMGSALGGVALTTYGYNGDAGDGSRGGSRGTIPNGYTFYRVWTANDGSPWPDDPSQLNPVGGLTAVVMMAGDTPFIYFHGLLTQAASGLGPTPPDTLFLVSVDYGRTPPVLTDLRVWVFQGMFLDSPNIVGVPADQLPLLISRIGTGDTNALGHYATTLTAQDLNATVALKN